MPCSHCQGIGHNKRTCPEFKKTILQKPNILPITKIIQQQNKEYEEGLQKDLQKQKEAELAEPSVQHLRELRLQFFQNGNR